MKPSPMKKKTTSMPRIIAGKSDAIADPARKQRIQHYETAVRLMREGKYEKAKAALEAMTFVRCRRPGGSRPRAPDCLRAADEEERRLLS